MGRMGGPGTRSRRPRYSGIFERLEREAGFVTPQDPISEFCRRDIDRSQHAALDGPVAPARQVFRDPREAARVVSGFARQAGADLVGFTRVKRSFVFEGVEIRHRHAVILGLQMDYDRMAAAPAQPAGSEALRAYWVLGGITVKVAEFVRSLGYAARAHHPRSSGGRPPTVLHTLAAVEAGLGETGRSGLLVTREFGPRVRLSTVTTALRLPAGGRKAFGVDRFCRECRACREACEGGAIPDEKKRVRGVLKYTIDPDRCLPVFARYDGCGACIARCPFNRGPGTGPGHRRGQV